MPNTKNVQKALDIAVREIAALPSREWPVWITYLLEMLDEQGDDKTELVYRVVEHNIKGRLVEKEW